MTIGLQGVALGHKNWWKTREVEKYEVNNTTIIAFLPKVSKKRYQLILHYQLPKKWNGTCKSTKKQNCLL